MRIAHSMKCLLRVSESLAGNRSLVSLSRRSEIEMLQLANLPTCLCSATFDVAGRDRTSEHEDPGAAPRPPPAQEPRHAVHDGHGGVVADDDGNRHGGWIRAR